MLGFSHRGRLLSKGDEFEVRQKIKLRGVSVDSISLDATLSNPSDFSIPSELAVKTYVDNAVSSGLSHWTLSGNNIYNNNTGNVGIGTSSPLHTLHLLNSTTEIGLTDSSNNTDAIISTDNAGSLNLSADHNSEFGGSQINFDVDGQRRMNINGLGSVGINVTTPTATLDIDGNLKVRSGAANGYIMVSDATGLLTPTDPATIIPSGNKIEDADTDTKIEVEQSSDEDKIRFKTANVERMTIENDGRIFIGDTFSSFTTSKLPRFNFLGGSTSNYRGLMMVQGSANLSAKGAMTIVGGRFDNSNDPYSVLGTWDEGTIRRIYLGGGGWSMPDATEISMYTAPTYTETTNQGIRRVLLTGTDFSVNESGADFDSNIYGVGGLIAKFDANNKRLGLSTSSPTQLLHVNGNARITGAIYDSNNDTGTSDQIFTSSITGTDWKSANEISGLSNWTLSGNDIYNNNSGNVGIGTSLNWSKLFVLSQEPLISRFRSANNADQVKGIRITGNDSGGLVVS